VAGIIGANGTLHGVAPGSKQLALKVLSASGYGSDSNIIAAMEFATDPDRDPLTDDGADASSMSLGGWSAWADDVEALAADASTLLGTVCIVAAGNSGPQLNTVGAPGISRESITVGSTTKSDTMSGFSSRGPTPDLDMKPDVSAPGSSILSTRYGSTGGFVTASGTSMATPHVSGAVALIKQAHPNWTTDEVRSALVDTGVDIGRGVYEQGGGRLDALAAVTTELSASPYKLPLGRLSRLAPSTNFSVTITNVGTSTLTVNFSANDVFGLTFNWSFVNNNTDLDQVTVSPATASLDPGGSQEVTVTATPGAGATPGYFWGYVQADAGTTVIRVPLAFGVRAPVLLVDDDISDRGTTTAIFDNFASFPSSSNNLSAALTRAGVAHDIHTTVHYGTDGPDELALKNYDLVIWNTGYDYDYNDSYHRHYTISPGDQAALASYLDVGGQLWLLGESIPWDVYGHANTSVPASDFLNAYLGVGFVEHELNTPSPTNGTAGTFMAGASYTMTPDWINEGNNGDFASNLTPTVRGFTVLEGATTDIYGKSYPVTSLGVAVNNSTYKSVFWGVEYSWLGSTAQFDDAMNRTLSFFTLGAGPSLPADDLAVEVELDPHPLDWLPILKTAWGRPFDTVGEEGEPMNVSVSVVNLGTSAATNVQVTVSLVDNASLVQQAETLTFPSVPALARVTLTTALTAQKHGYFTVEAALPGGDANATNDMASSAMLVPNWMDDISAGAAGWTLSSPWVATSSNYWTAPASLGANPGGASNASAVSPVLNFTHVNASATSGGVRLYLRISGLVNTGDTFYVETRNTSASLWTVERALTPFSATTFWNYFLSGVPLSTLAGAEGQFRLRLETANGSSSYFFADHFMAWTFHEYGFAMNPSIAVTSATRQEAQVLDFRATHDWAGGDTNPANYSYAWDFGDAGVSNARNTTHAFADDGAYLVRLVVDHVSGEREVAQVPVVVANVAPSIGAAGSGANPSDEGSSVTFSATCTDPSAQDTVSYAWSFGDGGNTTGSSPSHRYADDGNYTVQLACFDEDGGLTTTSFTQAVNNVAPAVVSSGSSPNPSAEGQVVNFTADCSDVGDFDNLTFEWDFGDGSSTATGANVSHTYIDDGNYTVTLTCTDTGGGVDTDAFAQVVDNVAPAVGALQSGVNPSDEGAPVLFTASCTDVGVLDTVTYTWDFGDGSAQASGASVNHTFLDEGDYNVTVTCDDGQGGVTVGDLLQTVLNVAPTAHIVAVNTSLEGASVSFGALASDPGVLDTLTYVWDFGDSSSATGPNVSHVYRDNGLFTVTLTVSDPAPASTIVVTSIQVFNVAPTASANYSGSAVEGGLVNFSATVTDPGVFDTFSYLWQFGDSQISTLDRPSHAYLDDGSYGARLTVTDKDGGSTTFNFTVVVANVEPRLTIAPASTHGTEGSPMSFTFNATDAGVLDVLNLTVDFGDGSGPASVTPGVGVTASHAYPDEGAYLLVAVLTDGDGGQATLQLNLTVDNVAPVVLAEASAYVIDEGGRVNLTANATDPGAFDTFTLSWDLAGVAPDVQGPDASVLLSQDGTYQFTVTAVDNDGGLSTVTLEIVVQNVAPSMTVVVPSAVHEAVNGSFSAAVIDPGTLDVVTVMWSWGDGEVSFGQEVTHAWADIGEYTLTVTATDDGGGVDTQSFAITVANSAPRVVSIDLPLDPVEGAVLNFSATIENLAGEPLTYAWAFGDGGQSQMATPSHGYRDNGAFEVTLSVDDGEGGTSSLTLTVSVMNLPPEVRCDLCPDKATQGRTISVRASANDSGRDDTFTFTLRLPDGTLLSSAEGIFDFQIATPGPATIVLRAQDSDGDTSADLAVTIDVQVDTDGDGLPDVTDTDDDNDGVDDAQDPAPLDPTISGITAPAQLPVLWILLAVMGVGVVVVAVLSRRRGRGDGGD
jgi:PKD repeat protein